MAPVEDKAQMLNLSRHCVDSPAQHLCTLETQRSFLQCDTSTAKSSWPHLPTNQFLDHRGREAAHAEPPAVEDVHGQLWGVRKARALRFHFMLPRMGTDFYSGQWQMLVKHSYIAGGNRHSTTTVQQLLKK